MPNRALLVSLLVALSGIGIARAETSSDPTAEARAAADRLVIEGKKLGDAGRVMEAIERFKAAEARYPRAIHGCNIGLAYAQLKSFPQALLFLEQCRSRATGPLPGWVEARFQKTLETLRAGGYSAVEIITDPPGAEVHVVGFARDESFVAPRTVWLSSGEAELSVSREGYVSERRTLKLTAQTQRLEVKLQRVPEPVRPPPDEPKPIPTPTPPVAVVPPPSLTPPPPAHGRPALKIAGGVLLGVGVVVAGVGWVPGFIAQRDAAKLATAQPTVENQQAYTRQKHRTQDIIYPTVFAVGGAVALTGVGILVAGYLLPASNSKMVSFGMGPELGGGSAFVAGRF